MHGVRDPLLQKLGCMWFYEFCPYITLLCIIILLRSWARIYCHQWYTYDQTIYFYVGSSLYSFNDGAEYTYYSVSNIGLIANTFIFRCLRYMHCAQLYRQASQDLIHIPLPPQSHYTKQYCNTGCLYIIAFDVSYSHLAEFNEKKMSSTSRSFHALKRWRKIDTKFFHSKKPNYNLSVLVNGLFYIKRFDTVPELSMFSFYNV